MFLCLSWDSTITQNSIRTISDLNRSRLTDTRSAENDRIGADTDPEYRINASPECILVSPEIYDHFHCFERVKLQVVKTAQASQLLNLLSVSRLVTILNEADDCGVFCKLQELTEGSLDVQSFVYREKSSGERTQP